MLRGIFSDVTVNTILKSCFRNLKGEALVYNQDSPQQVKLKYFKKNVESVNLAYVQVPISNFVLEKNPLFWRVESYVISMEENII